MDVYEIVPWKANSIAARNSGLMVGVSGSPRLYAWWLWLGTRK